MTEMKSIGSNWENVRRAFVVFVAVVVVNISLGFFIRISIFLPTLPICSFMLYILSIIHILIIFVLKC